MSDYEKYREKVGISNKQVITTLKRRYDGYGKATNSMINNPDKYGLCLLPEAEQLLATKFGYNEGLNIFVPVTEAKKKHRRKKRNRLVVYLDDDMYKKAMELKDRLKVNTNQAFLVTVLSGVVEGALNA